MLGFRDEFEVSLLSRGSIGCLSKCKGYDAQNYVIGALVAVSTGDLLDMYKRLGGCPAFSFFACACFDCVQTEK